MIRSMTGYGEAERETPEGLVRVEIKSVNHRYFNAQLRTPSALDPLESRIQAWLKEFVSRGRLNVSVRIDAGEMPTDEILPELDLARARRYLNLLEELGEELGLDGRPGIHDLLHFRDIFVEPDPSREAPEVDEELLRSVVDDAARALVSMREAEGRRLQDDLEDRLEAITAYLDRIEERAPERLVAERERLRERIRKLVESDEVDEERLAREIAYLAEKWDINEEVVRFRAHVEHFHELLGAPGEEAAGKRLGFVVQEMHREANTIGAKANDASISQAVVGIKEEIERLREQVENVE